MLMLKIFKLKEDDFYIFDNCSTKSSCTHQKAENFLLNRGFTVVRLQDKQEIVKGKLFAGTHFSLCFLIFGH